MTLACQDLSGVLCCSIDCSRVTRILLRKPAGAVVSLDKISMDNTMQTAEVPGKFYDKRRQNIRNTWMPQAIMPGFVFAFITGVHDDAAAQAVLEREEETFEDIVFLEMQVRACIGICPYAKCHYRSVI